VSRQAIEEGFILDVLRSHTPYKLAFRLASGGKEWDEKEVERELALQDPEPDDPVMAARIIT
jgi:type I restriction enzyme, R subunit